MAGEIEKTLANPIKTSFKPKAKESEFLVQKIDEVNSKQGIFGNVWNGLKETFDVGQSYSDCESKLQEYQDGKISFDEALNYIEQFDKKQENMSNLISNIATGIGTIAATVMTGGGAIVMGAPLGAAIKTGLKTIDRATNKVQGDALNGKNIAKDIVSGALTGATSAVSSGVGLGIKAGKFGMAVRNGTQCGLICGAASGAGTYMTDVAFGDKDFNAGELAANTVSSAFISGTVGAAVGAGMYGMASIAGNTGKEVAKSTTQQIIQDSTSSTVRKVLNQSERNILAA